MLTKTGKAGERLLSRAVLVGMIVTGAAGAIACHAMPMPPLTPATPAAPEALAAPANLTAVTESKNSVKLQWTAATGSVAAEKFEVERRTNQGAFHVIRAVGPGISTITNSGLTPHVEYSFRVRAVSSKGMSAYSNTAVVVLEGARLAAEPKVAPGTPVRVRAEVYHNTAIRITWGGIIGAQEYAIERQAWTGPFEPLKTVPSRDTEFIDTTVADNTMYGYRVQAINDAGKSEYSNEWRNILVRKAMGPAAPSRVEATALTENSVRVTWAEASTDVTQFAIERQTGHGPWMYLKPVEGHVMEITNEGLAPDETYSYRVRAVNATGTSALSNEAQIIPGKKK